MFVLSSDFDVPPFSLPDLGSNNSFGDYVDNAEEDILKRLLGKTFYSEFIAALAALPDEEWSSTTTYGNGDTVVDGNDVWTSLQAANLNHPLVEGAWWTLTEQDNKWLKLKNGADYTYEDDTYEWVGMNKMLIPYIYAMWTKDTYDTHTGNGIVVPDTENGGVINPGRRICAAYNKFSDFVGHCYNELNTLYGYLKANDTDFPGVYEVFKPVGRMNTFDL
jgi:hypothetical protein